MKAIKKAIKGKGNPFADKAPPFGKKPGKGKPPPFKKK
jgi:hypothetical protein